jgi:hypothetical protein
MIGLKVVAVEDRSYLIGKRLSNIVIVKCPDSHYGHECHERNTLEEVLHRRFSP